MRQGDLNSAAPAAAPAAGPPPAPAAAAAPARQPAPGSRTANRALTRQAFDAAFGRDWLQWQCEMITGVRQGAIVAPARGGEQALLALAVWPGAEQGVAATTEAAARAMLHNQVYLQSGKRIRGLGEGEELCDVAAVALRADGEVRGAAVIIMAARSEPQQQAVSRLLQWGAVWLERRLFRPGGADADFSYQFARRLIGGLGQDSPRALAQAMVDDLAARLNCARVSIGLGESGGMQLQAISQQRQFDPRTQLVQDIEEVMDATADAGVEVCYPAGAARGARPDRFQRAFARRHEMGSLGCWPLLDGDRVAGVLMLEWRNERALDGYGRDLCRRLAELMGPALTRSGGSAGRPGVIGRAAAAAAGLMGRGRWRLKAVVALTAVLALALSLIQVESRITAPAAVQGAVRQSVVAPRAGYLAAAEARAGDLVQAGQLLARLDTRDLELELGRWRGERDKHRQSHHQALARHDRSGVAIAAAQVAEAEAQLRLLEDQLRRSELRAPFAGLVVSGDLSQAIGAPVTVGEPLFEVASAEAFRIVLQVDERDVGQVHPGQAGVLRLAAEPGRSFALTVQRVVPLAVADAGANQFRVEASLDGEPPALLPGMAGVAKLEAGPRALGSVLAGRLGERLGLWLWSAGLW